MVAERSPYLVRKSLNSYLRGSAIFAISGQLATTTDALVVSYFIGSKGLSAVNIILPILTLFSSIMILLGAGASVSISKAMGLREGDKVNLSASSTLIVAVVVGLIIGIIIYFLSPEIVNILVSNDLKIENYALEYLKVYCFAAPLMIVSGVLERIVSTDGNSKLVSIAVWIGIVSNFFLDILLVGYTNLGIAGAAWATGINYLITLIICLFHFISRNNTIKWSDDYSNYLKQTAKNCKYGFSTSLNNFLLAVTLFVINNIVIQYEGSEGIYCWAVCYQVFIILQMLLSCIDTGIFALGGVLVGEEDVTGLNYLYKRCLLYLLILITALSCLIIIFPEFFGYLFGNKGDDKLDLLPGVLKIFSLFLLPFALVSQIRSIYTILDRGKLSLSVCILSYLLIIVFSYFSLYIQNGNLWLSFPISAWFLFIILLVYTTILHFKNKNLRIYSLIPKTEPGPSLNISVPVELSFIKETEDKVKSFLIKEKIKQSEIEYLAGICKYAMESIFKNLSTTKKKHKYFDLHIRIKNQEIILIFKDDGKRLSAEEENRIFSTFKCNGYSAVNKSDKEEACPTNVYYFYLNNQNTFTLNISNT